MIKILKKHTISFKNAINGLIWSLKTQPNYRVHLLLSLLAIIGGFIFKVSDTEWFLIIILIIFGLVLETINTAIELTTDAIDTKWREDLGLAKDVSAAAMLIFAIGSLIVAAKIFLPRILSYFIF